ncbi:MAG: sulfatase-like hydrolase/transferase [Vicinamibacterales bacterium]
MRRVRATRLAGLTMVMASLAGCGGAPSAPSAGPTPAAPAGPPRSVVLVTIDTLRADRLTPEVAPTLSALASTSVRFTTARTAVPLTLPSHTTLLTGQRPPQHGVRLNGQVLGADVPTLATALKDRGYQTAAFVGAYALDRRFGLARGFSTYDDQVTRDWDAADRLEAERPAGAVVDAAIAWLDRAKDGPFFLWVHLYDPHAPYAPPEPYRTRFAGRPYDGEIAYADAEAGRLLTRVRARDHAADTVVIVAGDHGEGLGDHGEATHGMLAYDATLRVPLLVQAPGLAPGVQAAPVSLADVAGAVLRLSQSGASLPAASARDVFDGDAAAEVYAETEYPAVAGWHPLRVLAGASRKLIRSSAVEFYDVASDARETTDLAARDTAAARQAVARLAALPGASKAAAGPSAEAQARLRSLGYASGPSAQTLAENAPNPATVIDAWTRFERATALPPGPAAVAALEALTREHPEGYVFVTGYARALAALDRHADAARALKAAVARFPQDAPLFHDLAVAAREAGDAAEALKAEQAALALDDAYAAAHHGLGLLYAESGRAGEALGAFTRAVELDPGNAAYWADLGNANRDDGDVTRADEAYGRALSLDPKHADAANGRGVLLVQAGRPADAIGWFTRALSRDANFHGARLNLGIAYQQSGQAALAEQTFRELLRRAPRGSRERDAATKLLASRP